MFARITTRPTARISRPARLLSQHTELESTAGYCRSIEQAERNVPGEMRESCALRILVLERELAIGSEVAPELLAAGPLEPAPRSSRSAAAHSRTRPGPRYTRPE